jgi:hypothetical protein
MEIIWTDEAGRAILAKDIEWSEGYTRVTARAAAVRHFDASELRRVQVFNREVAVATVQRQLI